MIEVLNREPVTINKGDCTIEYNLEFKELTVTGGFIYVLERSMNSKESYEYDFRTILITPDDKHPLEYHLDKIKRYPEYFWEYYTARYQGKILKRVYYKLSEFNCKPDPQIKMFDISKDSEMIPKPLNAVEDVYWEDNYDNYRTLIKNTLGFDSGWGNDLPFNKPIYVLTVFVDPSTDKRPDVIKRCEEYIKAYNDKEREDDTDEIKEDK